MNKIILIAIGIAVALGIVLYVQFLPALKSSQPDQSSISDTKYVEANSLLKEKLATRQIEMSSPIKIGSQDGIKKYCSFFTSDEKQKLIQYCTSTEIKNQNGTFLGNVHMVGTKDEPQVILTLIQTDKSMSQLNSVKTIFETVSEQLVCDCWSEHKPGGLNSIDSWVDGLRQFHQSDTKSHSKSNMLQLNGKAMQLELTTNDDGYLWQFFIYN